MGDEEANDLGIFNGASDGTNPDLDSNHAKDFAGRILRLSVAFEQTRFEGGLAAADKKTLLNRNTENVSFGRTQINS